VQRQWLDEFAKETPARVRMGSIRKSFDTVSAVKNTEKQKFARI
jgi:hypothetical protein